MALIPDKEKPHIDREIDAKTSSMGDCLDVDFKKGTH
jgi:hypothetical protein